MRLLILLVCCGCAAFPFGPPAGPVAWRAHVIEANIPGGYAVMVTDINNDGRPDVVGLTSRITELAWYENPTWRRHVLVTEMPGLVNMAARDVDGDGIPEIALQNEFSMVAAKSRGLVWLLKSPADPTQPWNKIPVDELTTSHHVAWADVDGDGRKEMINAPLIGAKALAPKYEDHVSLVYYRTPPRLDGPWKRLLIDDTLFGVLHRVRVVQWDGDRPEELLTAGFSGITLHQARSAGGRIRWQNLRLSKGHEEEAPRAGASDVALGRAAKTRFLASVEPWHGNEVVVYTQENTRWRRQVIYDQLVEGHEVCVADFNQDGRDDIAAGDRARGQIATPHLFYGQDDTASRWRHEMFDEKGMSASGCAARDINGDGRIDLVMIGGATHNIKWYENLGVR